MVEKTKEKRGDSPFASLKCVCVGKPTPTQQDLVTSDRLCVGVAVVVYER